MSTALEKKPAPAPAAPSVEQQLYDEPGKFDFYQAVSLLEKQAVSGRPAVRFETPASTAFPASEIESLVRPTGEAPARMVVNFMGLTGPSGVLPRHYTERLIALERRLRGAAKRTLRAWYDLFSNRFIAQMARAWAGRRIDRGVASGEANQIEADRFTNALHSLAGVGLPALRDRHLVRDANDEFLIDRVPDQALVHHAGVLARRQRPVAQIEAVLTDYFKAPVALQQFRGQWLKLEPEDRTRLGEQGQANQLGVDAVVGDRVWDVQSRIRVCVGPLSRERFEQFLPDASPGKGRRRFHLLCQLVRTLIGSELDFDIQLILEQQGVAPLKSASGGAGARLGWDAWLAAQPLGRDGDEPVFEPIEATTLNG